MQCHAMQCLHTICACVRACVRATDLLEADVFCISATSNLTFVAVGVVHFVLGLLPPTHSCADVGFSYSCTEDCPGTTFCSMCTLWYMYYRYGRRPVVSNEIQKNPKGLYTELRQPHN